MGDRKWLFPSYSQFLLASNGVSILTHSVILTKIYIFHTLLSSILCTTTDDQIHYTFIQTYIDMYICRVVYSKPCALFYINYLKVLSRAL